MRAGGRLGWSGPDRHVHLRAAREPGPVRPKLIAAARGYPGAGPLDLRTGARGRRSRRAPVSEAVYLLGPDVLIEREPIAANQDVAKR